MDMLQEETLTLFILCFRADYDGIIQFLDSKTNIELDIILNNRIVEFGNGTVLHVLMDWTRNTTKNTRAEQVCKIFELLVSKGAKYVTNDIGYLPWEISPYVPNNIPYNVNLEVYNLRNRLDLFRYEIPRDDA
jgi:hypothetical protein